MQQVSAAFHTSGSAAWSKEAVICKASATGLEGSMVDAPRLASLRAWLAALAAGEGGCF